MAVLARPVIENGFCVIMVAKEASEAEKIMVMINYLSATGFAPAMVHDNVAGGCIIGPVQYTNSLDKTKFKFCGTLQDAVDLADLADLDLHKPGFRGALSAIDNELKTETSLGSGVRIPRPRNAWIIFRQNQSALLRKNNPGLTVGDVSRIAATLWKTTSPEVKAHYLELAAEEAMNHREMYPDYHYGGGAGTAYPAVGHQVTRGTNPKSVAEYLIAMNI